MRKDDKNSILIVFSEDYQPVIVTQTTFSHQFEQSLLLVLMQFARHRKPGSSRHDHEGGNRKNKHSNFNQRGQWMDELMKKAIYLCQWMHLIQA